MAKVTIKKDPSGISSLFFLPIKRNTVFGKSAIRVNRCSSEILAKIDVFPYTMTEFDEFQMLSTFFVNNFSKFRIFY